ncbi:unnamed protein product [Cochlearia groenlandica]
MTRFLDNFREYRLDSDGTLTHGWQVNLIMSSDIGLGDQSKSRGKKRKETPPQALQRAKKQAKATKLLGVCPTIVKKKCPKGNLPRWPYRKIKSLERRTHCCKAICLG